MHKMTISHTTLEVIHSAVSKFKMRGYFGAWRSLQLSACKKRLGCHRKTHANESTFMAFQVQAGRQAPTLGSSLPEVVFQSTASAPDFALSEKKNDALANIQSKRCVKVKIA